MVAKGACGVHITFKVYIQGCYCGFKGIPVTRRQEISSYHHSISKYIIAMILPTFFPWQVDMEDISCTVCCVMKST